MLCQSFLPYSRQQLVFSIAKRLSTIEHFCSYKPPHTHHLWKQFWVYLEYSFIYTSKWPWYQQNFLPITRYSHLCTNTSKFAFFALYRLTITSAFFTLQAASTVRSSNGLQFDNIFMLVTATIIIILYHEITLQTLFNSYSLKGGDTYNMVTDLYRTLAKISPSQGYFHSIISPPRIRS